jgi:hypothetical protein
MMHPAAKLQFERVTIEYSLWRSIPEDERSPAPAWWWQPAFQVGEQHEEMPEASCFRLGLPVGSTYAAGAVALMTPIEGQTSQPWPDEFPFKRKFT